MQRKNAEIASLLEGISELLGQIEGETLLIERLQQELLLIQDTAVYRVADFFQNFPVGKILLVTCVSGVFVYGLKATTGFSVPDYLGGLVEDYTGLALVKVLKCGSMKSFWFYDEAGNVLGIFSKVTSGVAGNSF